MVGRKSKRTKGIQPEIQTLHFIKELTGCESQTQNSSRATTPIFHSQPETHMLEPITRTVSHGFLSQLSTSGPVSDAPQKHTQTPKKESDLHEENRAGSRAALARHRTDPTLQLYPICEGLLRQWQT